MRTMPMKNLQYGTTWINSGELVASPALSFARDDTLKETSRHNSRGTPRETSHANPSVYYIPETLQTIILARLHAEPQVSIRETLHAIMLARPHRHPTRNSAGQRR